jgi:hypothetical protein
MKNILFIILVISLISCNKETTTPANTSTTPTQSNTIVYSGKNLEVQKEDLPNSPIAYKNIALELNKINGTTTKNKWRLPTLDEIQFLYLDRNKIGGFREAFYFATDTIFIGCNGCTPRTRLLDFKTGTLTTGDYTSNEQKYSDKTYYVRLVKTIK